MPRSYLDDVRRPGQTVNPLFAFLGVKPVALERERAVLELPFRPEFVQGGGVMAGGLLAALADEAMAHVVLANLEPGRRTATVEMSVRYFRPVLEGALTATAELVHAGRRIVSVEAQVRDAAGRLAAKASGSFFILEPKAP
ncbi:Proofreading thioesterase EntH [Fundidesulfovibrio magnetotacticus]|uniref:Proofreading thioesterase EntH n=1 Tax=Fundidesulfovibrio magnetotacticus TaxID=2730080 RepID=A0A6V8M077_9BACT|nr:PaaI family thioesterase [Fundidesulfovibrio magnetotacticus]GFK95669.1 Proofreading thioesterase EntH [Fundidesulfovibrio magnetotacticus]